MMVVYSMFCSRSLELEGGVRVLLEIFFSILSRHDGIYRLDIQSLQTPLLLQPQGVLIPIQSFF